jgi:hypothetical protein
VINELAVSEESDVSEATDSCLSLLCCWDFEIFARSTCKEGCKASELENGNQEL